MAYNKDIDYQEEINKAVAKGDYASASTLEMARNEKIEKENLPYEKTNNYTIPKGVSGDTYNQYKTPFETSSDVAKKDAERDSAASSVKNLVDKENIISDRVWDGINKKFREPSAVTEADAWIASQLEKIQSGKTSYSDQVRDMMNKIMNREKFSYDVDTDPLFQQALASAMNSGKIAMQDTIGQASALTGGYGSTYATTAGNQAYNSFIEDAYDNLPQYYQMAMEAYQMEGDEMYRQYGMLSAEDDKEFNRNIAAYDATYQHRNQMYNEAYGQFRDEKADAFALGNLQLSEHGQRVSDATNYYNIASDQAETQYNREYTQWRDTINQAYQDMVMQNSDWQNQINRDFQASESQKQRDWQSAEAEKERAFTASENAKNRAVKSSGGGGGGGGNPKSPTSAQINSAKNAFKNGGINGFSDFLDSLPDDVNTGELIQHVSSDSNLGLYFNTYTKTKDTFNWFGGVDNNDKVTDQNGKEYKVKDLPQDVQKMITDGKKDDTFSWNPETKKWEKR